ncbi:MAG: response regulator transcription factor [Salibacteraceae bacterium]|jgi:DNA-binding NarL/FixJ family response regulator|nr:response regulator transcription factor [Salibacteraceae bacterium]
MEPQNILLVDDHKIIREGIKHYLEGLDNVTVIGEAQNGQQALEWLKSNSKQVTIALLDIGMDGMNGIQLCEQILQLYPEIKCIALSMFSEPHHIKQMMQAGAKGYMLKNSTQEELKEALENVASGRNFFTSEVTNIIMSSMAGTNKKSYSKVSLEMPLTERELEVLELVMKEFTNNEIADELFISPRTVDAHKRNLLEKTGSKNLAGLVMYAVHHSLFDDLY